MKDVTQVNWIRGITLERMTIVSSSNAMFYCIVRELKNTELDGHCDGCARRHSNTNLRCAMTQQRETTLTENIFYDFYTRKPIVGHWKLVDMETYNSSLGRQTWQRVAPLAATPTGAKLTDA